jgi:hypothetical protein
MDRRTLRRPSLAQAGRQRTDSAEDEECRLRARIVRRRLLLVEGHRPPPAELRPLHERAEPSDLSARGFRGRAAGDRGAAGPDGARRPLLLRTWQRIQGHCPRLRGRAGTRCRRGLYRAGEELSATGGIVFSDDWGRGQLSEEAFLHDFAGDLPPEAARVLRCREMPA